jgi:outer membrane murein-binding lipoprotein Lpp
MPADRSELSSIASLLDQLTKRVSAMAEQAEAIKDETVAFELYAIERTLVGANRRISRLVGPRS